MNQTIGGNNISYKAVKAPVTNPYVMKFFENRNVDVTTLYTDEICKSCYQIIQAYRTGYQNAVEIMNIIMSNIANGKDYTVYSNKIAQRLHYHINIMSRFDGIPKFNMIDYPRIYRTIGENEYNALLRGEHIVSPSCNNQSVMVTNNPRGVPSCTNYDGSKKVYFVHYKDKINFDPFADYFFKFENVQHVTPHNARVSEYYLEGGYNIEDVEKIIDLSTKNVVFPKNYN